MRELLLCYLLLFSLPLSAEMLISPVEAMGENYGKKSKISEENILLTDTQAKKIQENSHAKLDNKNFKIFKAAQNGKIVGYGILINKKIRSKNGVVLYIISPDSVLKSVEIVAFNEPAEYIPSKKWISQFNEIKSEKIDEASKNIPTITGATLSAKSIIDGSRVAFAVYSEVLKGK